MSDTREAPNRGRRIAIGIVAAEIGAAVVGGGVIAMQAQRGSNPDTRTPAVAALDLKSGMPRESSFSPNPDGIIDVFVPESAAPFSPLPSLEATPLPSLSATPKAYVPTGPDQFEVLEDIMTQKNSEIRTNITQPRLRRIIGTFWRNHASELNVPPPPFVPGNPRVFYSKGLVTRLVSYVGEKGDWARYEAGQLVYALARIAGDPTYSLKVREEAAKQSDVVYDAEVSLMPEDQREAKRNDLNVKIQGNIDFQLHPR